MVSIAKLISDGLKAQKMSQEDLADRLKVKRQTVSAWVNGKNGPKRARASAVAKILKIDVALLDPFAQAASNVDRTNLESHKIPLFKIEKTVLRAGDAQNPDIDMRQYASELLSVPESKRDCFAVRLGDNSMKPLYIEGDICIIDPKRTPQLNDAVIASFRGKPLVLRTYVPRGRDSTGYEAFDLKTPTADYETMTSNSAHRAQILGVLISYTRDVAPAP